MQYAEGNDPASYITQGSLSTIFNTGISGNISGSVNPAHANPILQCVQIKPLPGQGGAPDRYRVVFSDIVNFVQSMLATQANHVVYNGKLKKGSIVRLKSFQASLLKGKRILIVLDLEVLEELGESEKIGDPKMLEVKEENDTKPQPTTISSNGFYGNNNQQQQQPQLQGRSLPSRETGAAAKSSGHSNVYPIEALSPYQNKWTIKARCTHKTDIKTWHNKNGEGKLFSVNLLDESGEIRATGFNDQCDLLYDLFSEGGVYYITSPCRIGMAKKQFSNLNNDYEMTFERDTLVEKAEAADDVPQIRFNFTNIGDLQTVEKDTTIDTIGILKEVGEVSQITSKSTSKPYDKRELTLVDNTNYSVRLTIWGNTATTFDTPPESVVAFKGVKVSDFGGRSLSLLSSGSMTVDPDIDDAHKLKGWYDAQGRSDTFSTHAAMGGAVGSAGGRKDDFKTIARVQDENLGMTETTDYFTTRATIIYVKSENVAYPACLETGCNKKVVEIEDGWRCEKCNKTHPKPEYRYIMTLSVSDHTGQMYLNCFDDVGRLIMGMSADQLMELRDNDEKASEEIFQAATCKPWVFRCRAKMDNYQDQQRVRYQVSSANAVNFATESARLTEVMRLYNIN
ncbi:MAG: Replication factor A protein 1 [Candelina submexicana]|nr:MAG: Replication factor A protein 1 [Candelina submexicana]